MDPFLGPNTGMYGGDAAIMAQQQAIMDQNNAIILAEDAALMGRRPFGTQQRRVAMFNPSPYGPLSFFAAALVVVPLALVGVGFYIFATSHSMTGFILFGIGGFAAVLCTALLSMSRSRDLRHFLAANPDHPANTAIYNRATSYNSNIVAPSPYFPPTAATTAAPAPYRPAVAPSITPYSRNDAPYAPPSSIPAYAPPPSYSTAKY